MLIPATRKIRLLSHRPDHARRRLPPTQVSSTIVELATTVALFLLARPYRRQADSA
jgi:hypothetical protein